MVGTYNIGPKTAIQVPNMVFVSHYDPDMRTFTFVNDDFDLSAMATEVDKIKQIADKWVKDIESGKISPPFI